MANPSSRGRDARKLKQLCRQVQYAVDDILASECFDPELDALIVQNVEPIQGASHLRVILSSDFTEPGFDPRSATEKINALRGMIRTEVASSIHRKRAPELSFLVLRPGEMRVA